MKYAYKTNIYHEENTAVITKLPELNIQIHLSFFSTKNAILNSESN